MLKKVGLSKRKSHNFSLGLLSRDKKKPDSKNVTVYLFYSFGSKHSQVTTNVRIPKGAWNNNKREINIEDYPYLIEQQNTLLNIWKNKFKIIEQLKAGTVSRITAFEEITERVPNESLRSYYVNWYKKTPKVSKSTYNARLGTLDAIENKLDKLGYKEFLPITFEHLSDSSTLERLFTIMQNEFDLKVNGLYEYTGRLDEIYNKRFKKTSPFTRAEYRPSYDEPNREGIEYDTLLDGMYNISTLQDLETYLMYLYSIGMRGLNGIDIFKMRDEDFIEIVDDHYIPNTNDENYDEKLIYSKVRGKRKNKTSKKMLICANLYPLNHIREWLQWCIEINRPEYCRTKNEGYALFREFDEDEIEKIWNNNLRQTYRDKSNKLFGASLGTARHTFSQAGLEAGIPESRIEASVGHRVKALKGKGKSLGNYVKVPPEELHLIQAEIFDSIGMIDIFFTLFRHVKELTPNCKSAESFIPPDLKLGAIDEYMQDKGKLTIDGWSYLEEFKMKRLLKRYMAKENYEAKRKGDWKIEKTKNKKTGKFDTVTVGLLGKTYLPMTQELKELVDKKEKLVAKNKKSFLQKITESFSR